MSVIFFQIAESFLMRLIWLHLTFCTLTWYTIIIYLSFLSWDWLLIREVQWFYWTQKLLVPVEKFTVTMPMVRLELATPGLQTQCSSHWATRAQKLLLGRSWVYPVGVLHHYIFIISQLRLTSHPRGTVVLLDQEFLCPVEPLYLSDEKSISVEKW